MEWTRGRYRISDDPHRLDFGLIHDFLAASYWAPGISRGLVELSIENSVPFGLYEDERQVGFRDVEDAGRYMEIVDRSAHVRR